jgi:hypothetical protein
VRRSKIKPIDLAHNAIDQAFQLVLSEVDTGRALSCDIIQCFEILRDARIRLDNLSTKDRRKMLTTKDAKTQKLERELAACERSYRILVKMNPQSTNDTQRHLSEIDTVVRDMKRLRKRLCKATDESFLTQLLYPAPHHFTGQSVEPQPLDAP